MKENPKINALIKEEFGISKTPNSPQRASISWDMNALKQLDHNDEDELLEFIESEDLECNCAHIED